MAALSVLHGFVAGVGATVLGFCQAIGAVTLFALRGLLAIVTPPWYPRELLRQIMKIGYYSLPVVGLTAVATGGVLALQIYIGGSRFNAESVVASIVAIGMVRELGPVLGGLVVAGRVSAAIAAEIGTMRVTEQIDALTTLSTNPFKYLVAPRLLAGVLTMPILVAVADTIGIMGGWLVGANRLGFNPETYIRNTVDFLTFGDIASGLVKAAVFGFIITLMGCFHGYNSGRGAQGVGRATTNAVVSAMVLILAFDYLLTELFFST